MQQLLMGRPLPPRFSGKWETITLGELEKKGDIRLFRGQVISQKDIDSLPGNFPIYSSSVQLEGLFGSYGEYMFDEELITWSIDGGGHFFYRPKHKFSVTNVCGYLRILTSSIDYRYLAYHLQDLHSHKVFDYTLKAHPSVIRGSYRITLPSPLEQRAIVAVLFDMDELIGSLEALIDKKRAIRQALMQQLLTGRMRLPGFGAGWEMRQLGDHVKFLRHGTNPRADLTSDGTVGYLHYGDIHMSAHLFVDPSVRDLPTLPLDRASSMDRLKVGDLVFVDASEDIEGVGKSVEISDPEGHEIVSGLHTIAARFDKSVLADGFKAYLQFCPAFQRHLRRLAAGTKVYATNRSHIASVEISLPSVSEQRAIAAVLSDMDAEIVALERRLDKTRAIKQGMMQQLLTGSIRLPVQDDSTKGDAYGT